MALKIKTQSPDGSPSAVPTKEIVRSVALSIRPLGIDFQLLFLSVT